MSRAFTVIEVLVSVAIIGVLVAILSPALARAREQARLIRCSANMRAVATGTIQYQLDNNRYPLPADTLDLRQKIGDYLPEPSRSEPREPWVCPSDKPFGTFPRACWEYFATSFYYHFGTVENANPGRAERIYRKQYLPLFIEARLYHGHGPQYNASFPDGRVLFAKHDLEIRP